MGSAGTSTCPLCRLSGTYFHPFAGLCPLAASQSQEGANLGGHGQQEWFRGSRDGDSTAGGQPKADPPLPGGLEPAQLPPWLPLGNPAWSWSRLPAAMRLRPSHLTYVIVAVGREGLGGSASPQHDSQELVASCVLYVGARAGCWRVMYFTQPVGSSLTPTSHAQF